MEGFLTDTLPWLLVGLVAVAALLLLRQPIQYLARLCLRTLCSLAALAALSPLGPLIGVGLGVNLAQLGPGQITEKFSLPFFHSVHRFETTMP